MQPQVSPVSPDVIALKLLFVSRPTTYAMGMLSNVPSQCRWKCLGQITSTVLVEVVARNERLG